MMEHCQPRGWNNDKPQVFVGTLISPTSDLSTVKILENMALGVARGKILFVESCQNLNQFDNLKSEFGFSENNVTHMTDNQFLIPGFIDCHTHAPQFLNNGLALG